MYRALLVIFCVLTVLSAVFIIQDLTSTVGYERQETELSLITRKISGPEVVYELKLTDKSGEPLKFRNISMYVYNGEEWEFVLKSMTNGSGVAIIEYIFTDSPAEKYVKLVFDGDLLYQGTEYVDIVSIDEVQTFDVILSKSCIELNRTNKVEKINGELSVDWNYSGAVKMTMYGNVFSVNEVSVTLTILSTSINGPGSMSFTVKPSSAYPFEITVCVETVTSKNAGTYELLLNVTEGSVTIVRSLEVKLVYTEELSTKLLFEHDTFVSVGKRFNISIIAYNVSDYFDAIAIEFQYSSVISYFKAVCLKPFGKTPKFMVGPLISEVSPDGIYTLGLYIELPHYVQGNGIICVLEFSAVSLGKTPLSWTVAWLYNSSSYSGGEPEELVQLEPIDSYVEVVNQYNLLNLGETISVTLKNLPLYILFFVSIIGVICCSIKCYKERKK